MATCWFVSACDDHTNQRPLRQSLELIPFSPLYYGDVCLLFGRVALLPPRYQRDIHGDADGDVDDGGDVFRPAESQESGTPPERVLYHVIMMLVSGLASEWLACNNAWAFVSN